MALESIYPPGTSPAQIVAAEHEAYRQNALQALQEGTATIAADPVTGQAYIRWDQPGKVLQYVAPSPSSDWSSILNAIISGVVDIVAPGAGSLFVSPLLQIAEGKPVDWQSLLPGAATAIGAELGVPPVLTQELVGVGKIAAGDTRAGSAALLKGALQEGSSMGLLDDLTTLANEGIATLEATPVVGSLVSGAINPALSLINSLTDPLAGLLGLTTSAQQGARVNTAIPAIAGAGPAGLQAAESPNSPGTLPPSAGGSPVGSMLPGAYIPQGPTLPGAPVMGNIQSGVVQDHRGRLRYGFFKTVATRGTRTFRVRPVGVNAQGQMVFKAVRHMNPLNIHAARRALTRVSSLERVVKRIVHFTHPHRKPAVHAFPFHRRRKSSRRK